MAKNGTAKAKGDTQMVAAFKEFDGLTAEDGDAGDEGLTFDFSNVNENQVGELWPVATYPARVEDATFSLSQSSGNPMITLKMEVTNPESGKSRPMFTHLVFTEGGLPRVKRTLARLDSNLLSGPFNARRDAARLIGLPCQVRVKTEVYDGQTRNAIKEVLPAAEAASGGLFS